LHKQSESAQERKRAFDGSLFFALSGKLSETTAVMKRLIVLNLVQFIGDV
jgi:hypothetical protein